MFTINLQAIARFLLKIYHLRKIYLYQALSAFNLIVKLSYITLIAVILRQILVFVKVTYWYMADLIALAVS